MAEVPPALWTAFAFVVGAAIGSFLNVVVYRLPRGQSLVSPGSRCPHCGHALGAFENVPLLGFLWLRARCRHCGAPISWRYPLLEALTAALFAVVVGTFGADWLSVAYCLFGAALLVAFFVDLELFIIPDEVNAFALAVGVAYDVGRLAAGDPAHAAWGGWLPRSIGGAVVCACFFVVIQVIGLVLFKKEAMGDGDVKLARAIGAMLPLGAAFVSFALAIALGAVIGTVIVVWRRVAAQAHGSATEGEVEEDAGEPAPPSLGEVLLNGLAYILFFDLLVTVAARAGAGWARRMMHGEAGPTLEVEDDFRPGLTHIPFGPYMVVGALLSIFVGNSLLRWYLQWALPGPSGM